MKTGGYYILDFEGRSVNVPSEPGSSQLTTLDMGKATVSAFNNNKKPVIMQNLSVEGLGIADSVIMHNIVNAAGPRVCACTIFSEYNVGITTEDDKIIVNISKI